jgi:UBX domain-containing protein 6
MFMSVKPKVTTCVDTLSKYLDNIVSNPDEPKFQRIRCSNKAFQERVAPVIGAVQFLKAVGFNKQMMRVDPSSDAEEEFWVFCTQDKDAFIPHIIVSYQSIDVPVLCYNL